jgi:hypothetical protein
VRHARPIDVRILLLAVVPNPLLSAVAAGIDVIPEMCVWWPWPELLPDSLRRVEFLAA